MLISIKLFFAFPKQVARLSQRGRATLHVAGNFAKSFTQGHSRSFEITPLTRACVRSNTYLL